jgi:hypothetical protein
MRKIALLIISLNLLGCGGGWPITPPVVWQCQVNQTTEHPQGGFFCQTTHPKKEDRQREFREFLDPRMKGAQALPPDDYKSAEKWASETKIWIGEHCK